MGSLGLITIDFLKAAVLTFPRLQSFGFETTVAAGSPTTPQRRPFFVAAFCLRGKSAT
jgi:hypothetical protein